MINVMHITKLRGKKEKKNVQSWIWSKKLLWVELLWLIIITTSIFSINIEDKYEWVCKENIDAYTYIIPIIIEQVQATITYPSGNPSLVTPMVPPTTNVDEVDP